MRLWRLSKTLREDKCKLFKNQTCQPWKQSHSRHPSFYNLPTKRLSRGFWTEIYALLVNQTMQTVMFTRKKGISIILVWLFVLCTYNILPKERLEILRERICKLSSTKHYWIQRPIWKTLQRIFIILFSGVRATLLDQESDNHNHRLVCDQIISPKIYWLYKYEGYFITM